MAKTPIKNRKDVTVYDVYIMQVRLERKLDRFISAILATGKSDDLERLEKEVGDPN